MATDPVTTPESSACTWPEGHCMYAREFPRSVATGAEGESIDLLVGLLRSVQGGQITVRPLHNPDVLVELDAPTVIEAALDRWGY